jgi:hypothetical protein
MSLPKIVLLVGLHPTVFDSIYREYKKLSGSVLVSEEIMAEINKLSLDGDFPVKTGEELLAVMKLAAGDPKCALCKQRPPQNICNKCAQANFQRRMQQRAALQNGAATTEESATATVNGAHEKPAPAPSEHPPAQ